MYAIASLSPNQNGVRAHTVKFKKGTQTLSSSSKIAQVDTDEYRRLHKISNDGDMVKLMSVFNDRRFEHVIDVQRLTLHKEGCQLQVVEASLPASIIDEKATGLELCACTMVNPLIDS